MEEAIALVGAAGYATRPIGELSGGEQQRLLIAQALVRRPSLLILDEPLDSLDLPNQTAVAALLARICREQGVTVLLVAHDVNPLLSYLDRVVYFGAGRAAVGPPGEVVTAETLSGLYGVPIEVLRTARRTARGGRPARTSLPPQRPPCSSLARWRRRAVARPDLGPAPAHRLPVHGQRAGGGHAWSR